MKEHHDQKSIDYFSAHTPEYSRKRFDILVDFVSRHARPARSLLDVGCGAGTLLDAIKSKTNVISLAGMDVTENYLGNVRERLGCDVYRGSITNEEDVKSIGRKFDVVTVCALLHHLIGETRAESYELARRALRNTIELVNDNGYLLIIEPTFRPRFIMDVLFLTKKTASRVTNKRLTILGSWNNIGAPVVSYYSPTEVKGFLAHIPQLEIIETHLAYKKLSLLWRVALITERADSFIACRKVGGRWR